MWNEHARLSKGKFFTSRQQQIGRPVAPRRDALRVGETRGRPCGRAHPGRRANVGKADSRPVHVTHLHGTVRRQ